MQTKVRCRANRGFLPEYKSPGAAGADLKADVPGQVRLKPGERGIIPTGVWLQIPEGYEAQVRPRSGLAAKHGVTLMNSPGTIDSDYRGEIQVILVNMGIQDFIIERFDRIAQLVLSPVSRAEFEISDVLEESSRGESGFGSTGV
ncbi:MAG TPA: dUTP diphosphatase [Spirochaetia bacterium]|nr:dUTP diphosphatase [Spirochaetia bacterium]